MKRIRYKSFALLAMVLLTVIGCSNEPKIKTVLNPVVSECSDSALSVDKVILTDSMTIIDFAFSLSEQGSYLFTPTSAYIVAGGQKYKVIGSKNMPLSDTEVVSEIISNRTVTYSLIFPPIPFDTDSISFYEYDNSKVNPSGWFVKGIDLTGKSSTIKYKTKKDSEIYISKLESYDSHPSTSGYYEESNHDTEPAQESEYNYYCPKCNNLVQETKSNAPRPNSGQCSGAYHQWRCLGQVGSDLYECSHCGLEVYSQGRPDTGGCNGSSSELHSWQRVN